MEKVYVVNGWDGDIQIFHSEEKAMKEFNRRVLLADNCTLEIEEDDYICYSWYNNVLEEYLGLEFMELKFSD